MVALFGLVALYVIVAFVFSLRAFWRGINADSAARRPRRDGAEPCAMPAS